MYSLNRDEIVKNSDNNFIEVIDLPFLYSTIKYKYDVVGARNLMNSNAGMKMDMEFMKNMKAETILEQH